MIETDKCPYCINTETILLRVFECHILQAMWDQSTIYLQCLLPANHVWLYPHKLLWPDFYISPCCGASGSMRACHAAGRGSIPGWDRFPG